jgi:hypothetical protein
MEDNRLTRTKSAIERFNWSADTDTLQEVAAARRLLRAGRLQR